MTWALPHTASVLVEKKGRSLRYRDYGYHECSGLPLVATGEFGCRLQLSSPSVIQGGPILSLADLPVAHALEPPKPLAEH